MIEAVITTLIYICILAICVYLVIWVIGIVGIAIPAKVVQLIWVIFALIVVLLIVRLLLPHLRLGSITPDPPSVAYAGSTVSISRTR